MRRVIFALALAALLAAAGRVAAQAPSAAQRSSDAAAGAAADAAGTARPRIVASPERPSPPLSGSAFQSAETRQREADEFSNPAFLWVEEGRRIWGAPAGAVGRSCASCHGPPEGRMSGVATRYPRVEARGAATPHLVNLEGQINICRTERQQALPLAYESKELLALTTLVASQSRGMPRGVEVGGAAAPFFEAGRTFWQTRQGQLDLACTQCHDQLAGRRLRGDRISQGQSDGWPAYRLEWQGLGSLHRRLRACSLGVRAEVLDFGASKYLALELYLAWRGEGLPLSAPGLRR